MKSAYTSHFDLETDTGEDFDMEVKEAQGKNGQGEVPKSLWETYSAMANSDGGAIWLGVKESKTQGNDGIHRQFTALGIKDEPKVKSAIWNGLNNRQCVSVALLNENDVQIIDYDTCKLIRVTVPPAKRSQRPVYIGLNPLAGTYRRRYDGDYLCDAETVKSMLADAPPEAADSEILEKYGLEDIEFDSLSAYRAELKATKPNHPFITLEDKSLLKKLQCWRRDRDSEKEGLTLAGLLMFGKLPSIVEARPHFALDYQEKDRGQGSSAYPWLDRVFTDHSWSGNVYDFFRKVYPKLVSDLKVPFAYARDASSKRVDETSVHRALREALVNTIIHADYHGIGGIVIHKRPELFGFRNPGSLLIPKEQALQGGMSECRNKALQTMFTIVGHAEKSGSGIPKILKAWSDGELRTPALNSLREPDYTVLKLPVESLLPQGVLDALELLFPGKLATLDSVARVAVSIAYTEGEVTNERIRACTVEHPHDVTAMFGALVRDGLLSKEGFGRGTRYYISGRQDSALSATSQFDTAGSSAEAVPGNDPKGGSLPVDKVEDSHLIDILAVARPIASSRKCAPSQIEEAIIRMCAVAPLTLRDLANYLGRSPITLGNKYLSKLVREGKLSHTIPNYPNHPDQAYRSKPLS